ncbi:MAG: dienelactone hydrolase family protein [Bryobacterales bacterium]|nr:dienelactone hydrolase family protein [Bryobacterales bacterium]
MAARRDFLAGMLLALAPTDTRNLEAGDIEIATPDGERLPAYKAMPARGRNYACVLVIEEIFGLHAYIKDICRRYAKLGYCAVAPDLLFRGRDPGKVPDAQALADLDAALRWAEAHGRIAAGKIAVTGYGWGGRLAWLYAAHQPKVRAGSAWYGPLAGPSTAMQPRHPVDLAAGLRVPVLGLYGGQDRGIPLDTVLKMQSQRRRGRSGSVLEVYEEAPHGFDADYRESYRKREAEDGWARVLAWYRKHGVG